MKRARGAAPGVSVGGPAALAMSVLLGMGILGPSAKAAALGSDGEMKAAIEAAWNEPPAVGDVGLLAGEVRFIVGREPVPAQGEDALSEHPVYRAFARIGMITISEEKDLTSTHATASNMMALNDGVRRTARVTFTARGRQIGEAGKEGNVEALWFDARSAQVNEIVANDPLVIGTDKYRVVLGTLTFYIHREFEAVSREIEMIRHPGGLKSRFKALVKYDPFEKKWTLVSSSWGSRAGQLDTTKVDGAIAALQFCGRLSC